MATEALQIDALWSGLNDPDTGKSYGGAIVATFAADGSTAKAVWENKEKTAPSVLGKAQFTLDSNGQAEVFGDGVYVIKVYDSTDTGLSSPIMTFDGLSYIISVDPSNEGYDSIAEMRAGTGGAYDGFIKNVLGYYDPSENKDWQFQWSASSIDTDDGGKIIKVTSITTGRWVRLYEDYITAKMYGARGDGSDDSAFLFSWVTNTDNLHLTSGTYYFSTPWVFTGKHRNYKQDKNATLVWDGSTTGSAISFGDGGTTSTENFNITGLRVLDTVGIAALVHIDTATRMQFYDMYLAASYTVTSAENTLLLHERAWINSFYNLRLLYGHTGLELGAGTNATNFYGCIIEGQEQYGVRNRLNSTLHSVNFYGGTIESIKNATTFDAIGFAIEQPSDSLLISGIYFESNDTHITASHGIGTHGFSATIENCYFTSVHTAAASIVISSDQVLNLSRNDYTDKPLVEMTTAKATVYADGNFSRDSQVIAIKTAGVLVSYKVWDGLSDVGLKLNGHNVPEIEFGSTAAITAGGSLVVVFDEPFLVAPTVTISHAAGTPRDGVLTVGSITITGFTAYNNATQNSSGSYVALTPAR